MSDNKKRHKTLSTDSDRQQIKIIQATKCTLWKWLISLCRLNAFWGRITFCLAIHFIDKAYFIRYCFAFCRQMHVVKFPISFGGWKAFFHRFYTSLESTMNSHNSRFYESVYITSLFKIVIFFKSIPEIHNKKWSSVLTCAWLGSLTIINNRYSKIEKLKIST